MSLFLVKHQHPAEACPAGHPQMGPKLLVHLSQPSAESFGVHDLLDPRETRARLCDWALEIQSALAGHVGARRYSLRP